MRPVRRGAGARARRRRRQLLRARRPFAAGDAAGQPHPRQPGRRDCDPQPVRSADRARRWRGGSAMRSRRGRRCVPMARPARVPLSFAQQRLWFLDRLEEGERDLHDPAGAAAARGRSIGAALEAALGDVVGAPREPAHDLPRRARGAAPADPRRRPRRGRGWRSRRSARASACRSARPARRATASISRGEPPLRAAAVRARRRTSTCCCCCCITSPATAGRWRRCRAISARAYAARCRGGPPDWPALPVQYADYTLWQRRVLGDESDPDSAIARQLAFWTRGARGRFPTSSSCRPTGRGRRCRAIAAASVPLHARGRAARRRCWRWRERAGRACSWCCRRRSPRCSRGWARATTSRSAARSRAAPTARSRTSSASSSTRWCCAPTRSGNPSFRELIARVRAVNLAAYSHQDLPFERLVEVLNPARSLARHPLFQVMLAFQNTRRGGAGAGRADARVGAGGGRASAKFDLALSLSEQRTVDGGRLGSTGCSNTPPTCSIAATIEASWRRASFGCWRRRSPIRIGRSAALDILAPGSARTHPARRGTTPRMRSAPATLPELFARAGGAYARRSRGRARGAEPELRASSTRAPTSWRIICATLGVGPETRGRAVRSSARWRWWSALLGILKAGGAYLPLDPDYPRERLAYMLEDAGASVLVTQSALLRSAARQLCTHRAARRRLAGDRRASRSTAPAVALAAAQQRLCDLHLGLHRHARRASARSIGNVASFIQSTSMRRGPPATTACCRSRRSASMRRSSRFWGALLHGASAGADAARSADRGRACSGSCDRIRSSLLHLTAVAVRRC